MDDDTMMPDGVEPQATRLRLPAEYRPAANEGDLLPWSHATERLTRAENYWLATTMPDGRPYVAPVWGAWVDGALYFDGSSKTRWARNLAANPAAVVHLESGTDVVIVEGVVDDMVTDAELGSRIVASWEAKYGRLLPEPATSGIFRLRPRGARAWSRFPDDVTRWSFPDF